MKEFSELLVIADRLLGEGGCPWDREQTLFTLQPYLLEETHELIEAIDREAPVDMIEELGDVLYTLVFIAKLGEIQGLFSIRDALAGVSEKLIRRHPHVFGDKKNQSTEDVIETWEAVKKEEKGRKSIMEGIPPTLPVIARAQKIQQKLKRVKSPLSLEGQKHLSEEDVGRNLWKLIADAEASGVDAESALRRFCGNIEEEYTELG